MNLMKFGDPSLPKGFWIQIWIVEVENKKHWLWTGPKSKRGYGRYSRKEVHVLTTPNCPKGLERDHLCEIKNCCNPDCIEFVTHAENVRRHRNGKAYKTPNIKEACSRNHPYTGKKNSRGHNICDECIRIRRELRSKTPTC
jgi:hypothetical protein